jgi:hypothetical protein
MKLKEFLLSIIIVFPHENKIPIEKSNFDKILTEDMDDIKYQELLKNKKNEQIYIKKID